MSDDSQLYFHADPTVKQLVVVACIEEISHWMSANRLKLNKNPVHLVRHLSTFVCDTITVLIKRFCLISTLTCLELEVNQFVYKCCFIEMRA